MTKKNLSGFLASVLLFGWVWGFFEVFFCLFILFFVTFNKYLLFFVSCKTNLASAGPNELKSPAVMQHHCICAIFKEFHTLAF